MLGRVKQSRVAKEWAVPRGVDTRFYAAMCISIESSSALVKRCQ